MKVVRYTTVVDKDVEYSSSQFAQEVDIYLADPEGWRSKGYEFVRVDGGSKEPKQVRVVIHLSSSSFIEKQCKLTGLSCAELKGKHAWLNEDRWKRGAPKSRLALPEYRQYMVSHEVGHLLGYDHVECGGAGEPAPIMMQQTKGIGQCRPNTNVSTSKS